MASILSKEELKARLDEYYREVCGVRETDEWDDTIAFVNIRRFVRDGEGILLKCHVLTGEVTEIKE